MKLRLAPFVIAALVLLLAAPAAALDEVTFTAAPDVPLTLVVVQPDAAPVTAEVPAEHLPAAALQERLVELFGEKLDSAIDPETNVLTITGAPHTVAAALRLVPELDRRVAQIHFEATLLQPTKKGARKKTVDEWLERAAWSRSLATEAADAGLIEILSAPSITTVAEHTASIRDGACVPTREPAEGPTDQACPEGSAYVGFELQLLPRLVGERLLVESAIDRWSDKGHEASSETVVLEPREALLFVLTGDDGLLYLFVTGTVLR
jgi:hypothetical protein